MERNENNASIAKLVEMLSYRRPAGSVSENEFINTFIDPILSGCQDFGIDTFGNRWCIVRDADGYAPPILFTSHTDTVHRFDGRQEIAYDEEMGIIMLADTKNGSCLGADDGAGVWLMLEMLQAGVPGHYAFFREEECGGGGSKHMAREFEFFLKKINWCVSFDRAGVDSVVTEQGRGVTASVSFASKLADRLNEADETFNFKPDPTGVFTDSANLADVVPECTNLSIGYASQHSSSEYQDVHFLIRLRDACLSIDWDDLPVQRTAGDFGESRWSNWSNWSNLSRARDAGYDWDECEGEVNIHNSDWRSDVSPQELLSMSVSKLAEYLTDVDPSIAAENIIEAFNLLESSTLCDGDDEEVDNFV